MNSISDIAERAEAAVNAALSAARYAMERAEVLLRDDP